MAKVDNIIQQIRNAQAAAIAKNGGITANNGAAFEADTKKILQENIAAQKSAKKASDPASGQATAPAQQEPKDTRTTQQKYEDAQKALNDYTASDEYRIKQQERNREALRQAQERIFAAGASASDLPLNLVSATPAEDAREKELKATVDHYKQQMDAEENQRIRDADMKEIDAMSEDDREQLRQYISSDSKTGNLLVNSNPLLWFKENKALGDSAKYLFGKYGEEKTKQLASSYSRYLNEKEAEKIKEDTENAVNKSTASAIGHNILGIGTRLFGGLQATADRFGESLDRDERYSTLAPINSGDLISLHGNTVTAQTAQNIAGDVFDQNGQQVKDGGILRQGAAFLYQGGMTMVDSFARAAAGGGSAGAAAIAACNAFSQTVSQASQQGAAPDQAYKLGAAVAGIEYLSEKIPMDEVFKLAKAGDTKVLAQAFRQTGIEISTEELSLFGSMAAEAAILQEKSSYKQQIGDLVANGASYEEAKAQADKAVWEEVKQTAYVSGFAGFLSGGGGAIVGNLTAQPEAAAEIVQETAEETPVVEPVQSESTSFLEDAAQQLAQEAPAAAPVELTPEQQMIEQAAAETMGVQQIDSTTNAVSNSIDSYPPEKQKSIRFYLQSVDQGIKDFVQRVKSGDKTFKRQKISNVSDRAAQDIGNILGVDVSGYTHNINTNGVQHILNRHGETGEHDNTMSSVDDIARIGWVLENYDSVEPLIENGEQVYSSEFRDKNDKPAPQIRFVKKIDGSYYVVEAACENKYKKLWVQSAYLQKNNGDVTQAPAEGQQTNHETNARSALASPSPINIVPETTPEVNENPAVKPFYQEQAAWLLSELADSTKGERTYNEQVHYESGGERGWSGTKRHTSDSIAELLDQDGMTYDRIEKGLNAIINDNGQENNAVSKRIEFIINDRLMNGYTDFYTGQKVPGNAEYLDLLRNQQSAPEADGRNNGSVSQRLPGRQPVTAQPTPQANNAGIKGTGAAESNFSQKPAYNATLSEDNAQADRRDDVRPMELPQRDINGGNVSAVTGNVYGAGVTPDEFASLMEEPTARGDFSYVPISNNEATQQAMENISRYGWQDAYTQWSNAVHQGRAGAEMSARGALFLNHAAQAGNRQQWLNILSDFQRLGTNTAQGLQAFRILRNLAPSDRLYMMRRSVAQMVEDMHLNVPIEIDQQLADQYQNAQTNEEADAILDEIIDDVAAQIPSTVPDRWTALRYVNMLGNLRTQARNISGNIGAKFTYMAKDQIGAALEKVAHAFNPDFQRTKSAWVSNELKALGRVDFDEVRDIVLENGRFDDARRFDSTYFAREVNERRRIFRNGFMESYRRLTNWAMNNDYFGDAGFAKAAYARAFGGYLKANGFTGDTLEGIDQNLLDDARLYAIQQAQESTFRDHNAVSDWVGRIGRRQDTPRAIRTLSEGVMPFRSTPANVLVRAEEFSPLGIINTAVTAARAANPNSDITGTDVVESMAKTLTGTGLFIMGAYLGKMGALAGGPDPDDEKADFDQMNGYQNYSLQLGDGKNVTIDFLSPLAVPMFLGAEFEKIISDGGYDLADFETVFTSLADPLIQMSMLQGLNDTLDGIKYSENNLGQFFLNASMSYLTQGLTNTLMGQLERSSEENRMTTYIDKDSGTPQWLQRQLGKMSQKIPGWDYQQGEYLNAWGQTEKNEGGLLYNLLSPGYISTEHSDLVSRELYRLRETTGENVFPQTVEKTVSFTDTDGNHHAAYNLSQSELETMQKVEGQTAARLMAEVMTNGDYSGLTDKQKAQVVENIYSYAQEEARKQALPKYYSEASAWMRELGDDAANGLIRRATLSTINSSVTNTVDNIENGWEVTPAAKQDLDSLYDAYAGMSKEAKKQILDDAISDTAKFLEIRSRGVSTEQYLDVVADIKALKPEPTYTSIRDIQTREAIAENDSLSTKEKDYVMKAYMTDYDPTAKSPQTTELKYDAIRKLGISPEGYTEAYRMYLDASGSGKRRRTIAAYVREFGYDYSVARKLYDIYAGYWKPWTE